VSDPGELKLVQSFLTAPARGACPTTDEAAAWMLFHRAHTLLIRAVLKQCGLRHGDVDDLAQHVWIVLLKRLPTWEYDPANGTIGAYIGKIAGREAGRHVRRRSMRVQGVFTAELESMLLDPGPGPLSEFELKEPQDRARTILDAARSSLSDEDHRMLVMRYIDGRSVGQVAAEFFVSERCARKKLQRAIKAIKALTASRDNF
jgi:RNA polymerase sigma factor (sigma-70 family)